MSKESDSQNDIEQKLDALREAGLSHDLLGQLRTSIRLQLKSLPLPSVLKWLDNEVLKSGLRSKSKPDQSDK